MPLELTWAESTRVEETPGIGWDMFSKLFGGNRQWEWPRCTRIPGYRNFLCADVIDQPFAPDAAGKPGLLLRLPTAIETPKTGKCTIHVLSNISQFGALHYRGNYTRVPVPEIHFYWSDLPNNVRILKLLLLIIRQGFETYYSFRSGGSSVSIVHGHPPFVPSVHVSNFGTNAGANPPLWRSSPIFGISTIE